MHTYVRALSLLLLHGASRVSRHPPPSPCDTRDSIPPSASPLYPWICLFTAPAQFPVIYTSRASRPASCPLEWLCRNSQVFPPPPSPMLHQQCRKQYDATCILRYYFIQVNVSIWSDAKVRVLKIQSVIFSYWKKNNLRARITWFKDVGWFFS